MKKLQYLTLACLLAGSVAAWGQSAPKGKAAGKAAAGNATKGKAIFEQQQCSICHDAATTEKKLGPGLKDMYKRPKLSSNGKATNDANVSEKIQTGGNGMPPFKDTLAAADLADLLAYLHTL
jgi:mono/diheme cytochrome c family protein